jgi:predicted porin
VRAYAQGEGGGDQGWLATLEVRRALGEIGGFSAEGSVFHDVGQVRIDRNVWDPTQASNERRLSGTGFGLTLVRPRVAAISFGVAFKSSGAPPTLAEPARGRQVWIQVNALPEFGGADAAGGGRSQVKSEIYGNFGLMLERVSRRGATAAGPRGATQSLTPTGENLPEYARLRDTTSYVGTRGSVPLSSGTDLFWQVEVGVTYVSNFGGPDESALAANSLSSSMRDSAAGLRHGSYGTALYGKWDTPMKESTQPVDPFGGNYIASHSTLIGSPGFGAGGATSFGPLTQATAENNDDAGFNRRHSGIWQYWSPEWKGASFRLAYANNRRKAAPDVGEGRLWGGSASWKRGALQVILAYERHDNYFGVASLGRNNRGVGSSAAASVTANTWSRDWSARAAVAYTFGATQVALIADQLSYREFGVIPAATVPDLESYKRPAWLVSLQHQIGALELRANYGRAAAGDCTVVTGDPAQAGCTTAGLGAQFFALGFQYALNRSVSLFGHYARIRNEASASYNFGVHGVFAAPGRAPGVGSDPTGYGAGLRYSF